MTRRSAAANTTTADASGAGSVTMAATTCELRVGGMDCASCAASVERALKSLEGVQDVRVDVVGGKVRVGYAEGTLARGDLARAIRRVGYTVEDTNDRVSRRAAFLVDGLCCAAEARQLEDRLGNLPGVTTLEFDVMRHRLIVEGTITAPEVQRAIQDLGMTARAEGEQAAPASFWRRRGRLVMTAASGGGVALGLAATLAGLPAGVELALLGAATIAGGWFVVPRGVRAAMHRALDMNVLMSIAAIGAWLIGEPEEAAATLFLFAVAELLESHSMDRARNAIKALMDHSPAEATVRRDGAEVRVPATDVQAGETVVVRPGEKLPVDGEVTGGRSSVNQAPITGESMPVDKAPGAEVFAGSLNGQGVLEVRSTKPASDTTLARIIHAVEEAQASRGPSQTFVDRFARAYTPLVVLVAVLVGVVPPAFGWGTSDAWVYRALALLVVACPCALVISTPVTIVSGLAGAARGGVLIKGGAHLETAGTATVVCLDKTGTLTEGRPAVTDVVPFGDAAPGAQAFDGILRLALGVERHSEHPLARAVLDAGAARGLAAPESVDFEALVGRGARAHVGSAVVYLGNERLLEERRLLTPPVRAAFARLAAEGKTAVAVAVERHEAGLRTGEVLGVLGLADRLRPNARTALDALRAAGVRRLVMLTGDSHGTARAVAAAVGADEVHAELLPDDKVRVVRELEGRGERVVFVGDGVNDAPALAAASVGVAMGAAGTDVALETADVALMADDLETLPFAMRLSRKTLGIVKQNIAFSLAVKAVFLVLAVGGWATLWMAVAADMGGSLVVVANGLRARRL
ncbi:heavy metal translocating P-type ATPase [Roseisolibacter agri]|uniref:heavy metal translocating P-type ATPase n=1 Tax=Roseisolibacter agri TaxID=2014610 RepID=UPI0024E18613|nr:heavy metal translocating P-type ATPase [Roseisolibacter agri]